MSDVLFILPFRSVNEKVEKKVLCLRVCEKIPSFGERPPSKFTSRLRVSNRVYTSPNGLAGVTSS